MITIDLTQEVPQECKILKDHPDEIGDSWIDKVKAYQKDLLSSQERDVDAS